MMMQKTALCTTLFAAMLSLAACGGGGDDSASAPEPSPTPTPVPTLSKELCFDNSIYAAEASYKLNFKEGALSPVVTGKVTSTNATFNGTSNLVTFVEATQNTVNTVVTRYLKPLAQKFLVTQPASAVVAVYGTEAVQGSGHYTTTIYSPAFEDRRAELAIGETRTFVGQGQRTVTFDPQPFAHTREEKIKFAGIESVTMPAGTFTACRFEVDGGTEWLHRSIVIRFDRSNGESRILQSGELNGSPLKSQ